MLMSIVRSLLFVLVVITFSWVIDWLLVVSSGFGFVPGVLYVKIRNRIFDVTITGETVETQSYKSIRASKVKIYQQQVAQTKN